MPQQMTQYDLCYAAQRRIADQNLAFMDMVNCKENPMTNADLSALIGRRPERYGRFAGFIGKVAD